MHIVQSYVFDSNIYRHAYLVLYNYTVTESNEEHIHNNNIKVKLSLCLINYALCHEDIWGV
jgi:hypothetical protein